MELKMGLDRSTPGGLIRQYTQRLQAATGYGHHVVSPLGAWLMLALVAPLAHGRDRTELERVLGCDADQARQFADELLGDPHPGVALALAVWFRSGLGAALETWSRALPAGATSGTMPTQTKADQWALDHTRGKITSVPIEIGIEVALLLANAVATDVQWLKDFDLVPASELGGPWAAQVERVMRRECAPGQGGVALTEAAGEVGVSVEMSQQNLDVISVIAAPDVSPERVMAAAYEVAARVARVDARTRFIGAFDLPLEGHAWRIVEYELLRSGGPEREEFAQITIPAWRAGTQLGDLASTNGTGFAELLHTLGEQLPEALRGGEARAVQVVNARFDTSGFSAAAVTVGCATLGVSMRSAPRPIPVRRIEIRFDRPFAVVAVARAGGPGAPGGIAWRGLPAFAAWVTEPYEPSETQNDGMQSVEAFYRMLKARLQE